MLQSAWDLVKGESGNNDQKRGDIYLFEVQAQIMARHLTLEVLHKETSSRQLCLYVKRLSLVS